MERGQIVTLVFVKLFPLLLSSYYNDDGRGILLCVAKFNVQQDMIDEKKNSSSVYFSPCIDV